MTNAAITEHVDATDVARRIRADLKAMRKAGQLNLPADVKISVRVERASMMTAVDVNLAGPKGDENAARRWAFHPEQSGCTRAAKKIGEQITDVMRRHTNGYCWGDVSVGGRSIGEGIAPNSWRPGQD